MRIDVGITDKPINHAGDPGKSLDVYFPQGKWYDWYTHLVASANGGETKTIYTPINMIPVCYITKCSKTYACQW